MSAFNALNTFLVTETKYDPTTNTAATLQGDSTAVSIQNQMHALISQVTGASSSYSTLSSLGIQVQTDGSLQLDSATFNRRAGQPAAADQGALQRGCDERLEQRLRRGVLELGRLAAA